jgi:hypothetical protein
MPDIVQEWFIAPLQVIDQAIDLIISGEIIKYKFDIPNKQIIKKLV